ncbi:MAG: hypothetical protein KF799_09130 [Bdellovibrionales bacterium]|nr:hypothetical protein [Bdellovibrionales bacterium]
MRILVPAFAFVVFFGLTSTSNAAITLSQALSKVNCPAKAAPDVPGNAAASVGNRTCYYTAYRLCENPSIDRGECASYGFSTGAPSNSRSAPAPAWGSYANQSTLAAAANKLEYSARQQQQAAQSACSEEAMSSCPSSPSDAYEACTRAASASSKGSMNANQKVLASATNDGFIANSAYAGGCNGSKLACMEKYDQLLSGLQPSVCSTGDQGCLGEVNKRRNSYSQSRESCNRMDLASARQQAQSLFNNSGDSTKGAEKTQAQNGAAGAQSESVKGGSGSTGGTTNSAMAQQLLPMAMMMAQSLLGQQQQQEDPYAQQQVAADCSTTDAYGNPVLAGCMVTGTTTTQSWNTQASGESAAQSAGSDSSGFSLGDTGNVGGGGIDTGASPQSVPITTTPIANGGGGFGMGAASAPAQLGGTGAGGAVPGGSKTNTDILRGEGGAGGGGGGLAAMNANMRPEVQGGGGGGWSQNQGGSEFENLRLGDYLPGGAKYQGGRNVAGVGGATGMQIQSKSVNIWNKVSDIIRGRCAQGRLRDCGG